MDGGLDDPLVRMHRWDALRQRLAHSTAGRLEPVVDELVEAVAAVLQRHGPLTVTVTLEGAETRASAQVDWHDGRLTVARSEPESTESQYAEPQYAESQYAEPHYAPPQYAEPQFAAPETGTAPPPETSEETAARLAELIRRDPSLLDGRERWGGS
jgi:hypothetical protein